MRGLSDGAADYLNAAGAVLATGVEVIIDREVERFDAVSGMVSSAVTVTLQRHLLQPFDRKGALRMSDGALWHIDGIAADDGQIITFYVVP